MPWGVQAVEGAADEYWVAAGSNWSPDPDSRKHRSLVGECTASNGELYSQPAPTYAPYASAGSWPVTLLIWLDKYFMRGVVLSRGSLAGDISLTAGDEIAGRRRRDARSAPAATSHPMKRPGRWMSGRAGCHQLTFARVRQIRGHPVPSDPAPASRTPHVSLPGGGLAGTLAC